MPNWPNEAFQKSSGFFAGQAGRRIFVLSGYPGGSEDDVENRKVFAEILVTMPKLNGMMDPVKLRCVEYEHQGAELDFGIHMGQLLGQI